MKNGKQVGDTDGKAQPARKSGGLGARFNAEFKGYINLDLSDADKERFGFWITSPEATEMFDAAVTDGVNISVKIDPKGTGFIASATQRREDSPNAGLCVTARARAPELAMWRVVFCLALLYAGGDWESTQPRANPDRW